MAECSSPIRASIATGSRVSDALEASGYSVWWDRALAPSRRLCDADREARSTPRAACVVAWSKTARQSLWVRAEANEALDSGKLVQINLDEARLPLPFSALHFLDFSRWARRAATRLALGRARRAASARRLRGEWIDDQAPPPGPALQGLGTGADARLGVDPGRGAGRARGRAGGDAARSAPAAFGALTMVALAIAAVLLALAAFSLVRIGRASRR